jgi:hypothetical protein
MKLEHHLVILLGKMLMKLTLLVLVRLVRGVMQMGNQ